MTTSDTRAALERAAAPKDQTTILQLIERQKPAIEHALPAAIGAERFTRLVLTEIRRNPKLLDCTPESVLGSMMLVAQLGLEPGPLGHAYLVPFGRECVFVIGYTGIVALAYRSGEVKSIAAHPVYDAEPFRVAGGSGAKIVHELLPPADRGEGIKAYYALAKLKTGGEVWKVLYPDEVEARRKRSPAAGASTSPWKTDPLPMALKSCVKALRPWLPQSAVFARAAELDERPARWDGEELSPGEEPSYSTPTLSTNKVDNDEGGADV